MSRRYNNKIVFEEDGKSHPFIDMDGEEQVSYNLENDAVRNYLNNVTYARTDIITGSNAKSTTATKIWPYFAAKAHRASFGASESSWSEIERPVVIIGTKAGDTITLTSLDHTMSVIGTVGATLVYNLIPRRFYGYTVTRSNNVVKTGYFNTEGQCRMIKIQIPNFRDIGGWKCETGTISYNKVFRGCGFTGTDTGLYSNLRDAVNKTVVIDSLIALGITDELDLRDPNDNKQPAINPGYPVGTITYRNIVLGSYAINSNTLLALQHISNVLDNNGKIWLHCHTGADRAGTLFAIIQILLGCGIDTVIKEWELSMFCGNGYNQNYLDNTNFRTFLYNQYKVNTGKTLRENIITTLKNNKPSGWTNAIVDNIVSNLQSKLSTLTAAVIGDSYSAYTGSGPKVEIEGFKNSSVYAGEYPDYPMPVNKIWWAQVAQRFGLTVANYSWSGCTVTPAEDVDVTERVCCSDARIDRLNYLLGGNAPDIVFCVVGYNDANAIANNNRYGITLAKLEASYRLMLDKIVSRYPNARIYCLNNVQRSSSGDRFNSYKAFNTKLVSIVNDYPNASLVDVANVFNNTYLGNTVSDATHPNETGFTKIANRVIALIEPDFQEDDIEEEEAVSYDFIPTHLQPSGYLSGRYDGITMKASTYNEYEFAEFPVNAGDVVQIGVNGVTGLEYDGTKRLVFFAEYPGGALSDALALSEESYKTGWYSRCYVFHYGSGTVPLKTKTVNGRTHYYAEYTVQHDGKLTVGLKVNSYTSEGLGGAYVIINGTLKT